MLFDINRRTCASTSEQLLWNISEQLSGIAERLTEIAAKLDKPAKAEKPPKDPPPPLENAGK